MSLATLNPWQVLDQLQKEAFNTESKKRWHPATDISESEQAYAVIIDLPGVQPDQVNIEVHDQKLHISGERNTTITTEQSDTSTQKQTAEPVKVHYHERAKGNFNRVFHLPKDADESAVNANFEYGVLTVTIPKVAKCQPRKISINVK